MDSARYPRFMLQIMRSRERTIRRSRSRSTAKLGRVSPRVLPFRLKSGDADVRACARERGNPLIKIDHSGILGAIDAILRENDR